MSLLRRVHAQNNNQNQQTTNNANNQNNNTQQNKRNNRIEIKWTIKPVVKQPIRFQLNGLGDPLHRLLGTVLNVDYSQPAQLASALHEDDDLRTQLMDVLEDAWVQYDFNGAVLMYPWHHNVKLALKNPLQPVAPQPEDNAQNNNQNQQQNNQNEPPNWLIENQPENQGQTSRALDMAFILNVLGRTRSGVLVADTPLALETDFLERIYLCDDPRIIALAQATGCIEEVW